jgi:hypothetical protein
MGEGILSPFITQLANGVKSVWMGMQKGMENAPIVPIVQD